MRCKMEGIVETEIEKYKQRYNKKELTEHDVKFITSSIKMRFLYIINEKSRKSTVMLKREENPMFINENPGDIENKKHKKDPKDPKNPKDPKDPKTMFCCKAYKMNGIICNAKTDNPSCLCKRHSKHK